MEGGIAILLLLLLVGAAAVALVSFTSLGAALGLRRRKDDKDAADQRRPVHDEPTTPYHEHTRFGRPAEERERARTGDGPHGSPHE
jgi:hypothetical protein